MKKAPEMLRMEKDMNESPELREKLQAEMDRIMKAGEANSDAELMVKSASALGYELSLSEMEQIAAECQDLDLEEMEAVAGGYDKDRAKKEGDCWVDYKCVNTYHTPTEDEYGHNAWCITAWHCSLVTCHTPSDSKEVFCLFKYRCHDLSVTH